MLKNKFYIFFILSILYGILFLPSCQEQSEKLIIPTETLLAVLTDLHYAEAALAGLNPERKDSTAKVYYAQVFEIHGVSETDFNHDLSILKNNPKQLQGAYQVLSKKLEK